MHDQEPADGLEGVPHITLLVPKNRLGADGSRIARWLLAQFLEAGWEPFHVGQYEEVALRKAYP